VRIPSLSLTAAIVLAASAASARPHRVVVMDFDGPRGLADASHVAVVSLLGETNELVASRRWDDARRKTNVRGKRAWQVAAESTRVDSVVEGWIEERGKRHVLTVTVLEASTGLEVDCVTVPFDGGLSTQAAHDLQARLDDLIAWIDLDFSPNRPVLPL
jgi:hypothetical protein